MIVIEADARGGHAKTVRRAPIEVRVERNQQILRLLDFIAPAERRLNSGSAGLAVHAGADEERTIVVDEADLHALGRRRPFVGFLLDKLRERWACAPDLLVDRKSVV